MAAAGPGTQEREAEIMTAFDTRGRLRIPQPARRGSSGGQDRQARESGLLLTQVYCPQGHPLIAPGNPRFDGRPGVAVLCEGKRFSQMVHLSPFQGDRRKEYGEEFERGEVLRVRCATCKAELPQLAPHGCEAGAMHVVFFLTNDGNMRDVVAVCNVWGCPSSLLRMGGEVIAEAHAQVLPELAEGGFSPEEERGRQLEIGARGGT